jgi:hypothetical protein
LVGALLLLGQPLFELAELVGALQASGTGHQSHDAIIETGPPASYALGLVSFAKVLFTRALDLA